LAAYLEQA
jgi:alpha-1,3-mannosyltransferase